MDYLLRRMQKDYLTFSEKPVRSEERAIAERLHAFVSAYNNQKIDDFIALFADDATIESRSGGGSPKIVNNPQFSESTRKAFSRIDKIFFDNIRVLVKNTSEVHVSGILTVLLRAGRIKIKSDPLCLEFRKIATDWLITKNLYC